MFIELLLPPVKTPGLMDCVLNGKRRTQSNFATAVHTATDTHCHFLDAVCLLTFVIRIDTSDEDRNYYDSKWSADTGHYNVTTKANDSRRPSGSAIADDTRIPGTHKSEWTSGCSFR
jgi:hypothetical protein